MTLLLYPDPDPLEYSSREAGYELQGVRPVTGDSLPAGKWLVDSGKKPCRPADKNLAKFQRRRDSKRPHSLVVYPLAIDYSLG